MQQDSARTGKLHAFKPRTVSVRPTPMPLPKSKTAPSRIQIQDVRPQVDCGRYAVKAVAGDRVDVSATICRDGHEVLGAAVRFKRPGATRWQESALRPVGNDRFEGGFEVDEPGRWTYRIEAWVDRVASCQWEIRRKHEAGQEDLSSRARRGCGAPRTRLAHGRGGARGEGGRPQREDAVADVRARRRPRAWRVRLVVRALPALLRRLRRGRARASRARGARLRRRLPAAGAPDRDDEPQGAEQHAHAGGRRRREPLGDRRGGGRARGRASRPRHARGVRAHGRARPRGRLRDLHRLRDPDVAGPPVADRAPRVVPPAPRRHAEVRGEPAQALPGHLQRQLRTRTTGAGSGTRCATSCSRGSSAASRSSASTTRTRSRSRSGSG